MPILAQDLANQIRFALDAEGADHYDDNLDIIPAINAGIKWLVSVVNYGFGEDKINEEMFRDLTYSSVFRTSAYSRISLSDFPYEVWSILSIHPKPEVTLNGSTITPTPNDNKSYYLGEYVMDYIGNGAKRLSIEEWGKNRDNPFEAGYVGDAVCSDVVEYAYLNPITHKPDVSAVILKEIEIRPPIPLSKVGVVYVKKPNEITSLTDYIEFPAQVFNMLLNKALQYISYKQGDGTNLYLVTQRDLSLLLKLL